MASSTTPAEISKLGGSTPAEEHMHKQPPAEHSASVPANGGTQGAPNAARSVSSPVEGLVRHADGHDGPAAPKNEVEELKPWPKTLEEADSLFHKGCVALKENDIIEAVDSLSRALEIRVAHFGELAQECATSYFKYGCALLYKAQDEADPLNESVALAKKVQASSKDVPGRALEKAGEGESSKVLASGVSEKAGGGESSEGLTSGVSEKAAGGESCQIPASEVSAPYITDAKGKASVGDDNGKESATDENNDEEEDDEGEESDEEEAGEDVGEEVEDEEESDLDLAWKNLEAARVILDKQDDTIEKVDVISALGDVSLEREDFSTSANDYMRALSILEQLDQAQSRHIAELCFKICLALQMQNMIPEALSYCQRALSICTSCMLTLMNEVRATKPEIAPEDAQTSIFSAGDIQNNVLSIESKEEDIKVLKGLMSDLSDKVEDLKQMMTEPPLSEIVRSLNDKSVAEDKFEFAFRGGNSKEATVSTGFDLPKLANAPSNGTVTHLGVVGRGAKRAAPVPIDALQPAPKRLSLDHTLVEKTDCSAMEASETICQNSE